MKILMIGNGFDLDHGLNTKYTDFLEFIETLKNHKRGYGDSLNVYTEFLDELSSNNNQIYTRLFDLIKNNFWVTYFLRKIKISNMEDTWISFENEIKDVALLLNELLNSDEDKCYSLLRDSPAIMMFRLFNKQSYDVERDGVSSFIQSLISDLNDFIEAFEIYIAYYIDEYCKLNTYNPSIANTNFDALLSFNYSNTFSKLYKESNKGLKTHFIHGKANKLSGNHLVLGADDFTYSDEDDINDLVEFTKYYQRITKNTGSEYKKWLVDIQRLYKTERKNSHLYIFGHSLDVADKDIITELFNCEGLKITVYYKDEDKLHKLVKNLMNVLGKETVIEKTYGKTRNLSFVQQEETRLITESEFEVQRDILKLSECYKYTKDEYEKLYDKVLKSCQTNPKDYFLKQDNVIKMHYTLDQLGIVDDFEEYLRQAIKDICPKSVERMQHYDWEAFSEINDIDNEPVCGNKTIAFILNVNEYNKIHSKVVPKGITAYVDRWQNKIIEGISLKEYDQLIIESLNFLEKDYNQSIWAFMIMVSTQYMQKSYYERLNKLREQSKNSFDILRINKLISEIELDIYYTNLTKINES